MNSNEIKDRLKHHAKKTNHTFQDELTMYGLERTIFRLSISKYVDNFILKGGVFLYAIYCGTYARATSDIDFLSDEISNNIENIERVMTEIFSIQADDGLRYDLETISIRVITEFKAYHGLNVSVIAYLDKTRINIAIDIGFGDVIYPKKIKMKYPVILEMDVPEIYAYSLESVIAEKFEAIVQLGYGNSRYKDFYDIYILSSTYDFNGQILKQAIIETFEHRKTSLLEIVAFEDEFKMDATRKSRWDSFIRKKKAIEAISFETMMGDVKKFLFPLKEAIIKKEDLTIFWSHEKKIWCFSKKRESLTRT